MRERLLAKLPHDRRRFAPLVLILVLVFAAIAYLYSVSGANRGPLQASGTVEATQVVIAPELGGRVVEVLVQEGDAVAAGEVLLRLDETLLQAQQAQAQAALAQAQASYDLVSAGPSPEQRGVAIAAAQLELVAAQQALDELLDNSALVTAQALQAIANTRDAVRDAERYVNNLEYGGLQTDIDQAQARVVILQDQLEEAQEDFETYADKPEDNLNRAVFQSHLADAQKKYDDAVTLYGNLIAEANEIDLEVGQADLMLAQEQLELAREQYAEVQDGPDPEALELASARLSSAEAHLTLAQAEPRPEQLAMAQAQVEAAQAALEAAQLQLEKLTLHAPADGTVLSRAVEPGEIISPGTPVLTLGNLVDLTITVYIPEDRYGVISLGQQAQVSVDSFPGLTFDGKVVQIADQAEFTPRNVQTAEGRRTTVFAIKLGVQDDSGRLKPGMPADVTFVDG